MDIDFKVAIIGAGPSGLALARELKRLEIEFTIFEKNSQVGGLWDMRNPGTPLYESAHFISSKTMSSFSDDPMPDDYPDYPSHKQILKYLEDFAQKNDLLSKINFNTEVKNAEFRNEKWLVETNACTEEFDALICANGVNWIPNRVNIPGHFTGEIIHAVDYKDSSLLKSKNVLVLGAGNSACDIACDAATTAKKALISMRRGYHFLPKHIFGLPADVYDAKNTWIPLRIKQVIFPKILKLLLGDLTKYNLLKPEHKIFETHPILNTQLIHYLQHGDIEVRRDIEKLEGTEVLFTNGTRDKVDLIIQATGYKSLIPFLDGKYIQYNDDRPNLYLNIFSRDWKNLMAIGFMETNSGAFRTFELMAKVISLYLKNQINNSEKVKIFNTLIQEDQPDLSGGVKYVKSARHSNYINKNAYTKYMNKLIKEFQ